MDTNDNEPDGLSRVEPGDPRYERVMVLVRAFEKTIMGTEGSANEALTAMCVVLARAMINIDNEQPCSLLGYVFDLTHSNIHMTLEQMDKQPPSHPTSLQTKH